MKQNARKPRRTSIGYRSFPVRFIRDLEDDDGKPCCGQWGGWHRGVEVKDNQLAIVKLDTLIHELIEASCDYHDWSSEEPNDPAAVVRHDQIQTLGSDLAQALYGLGFRAP